MITLKNDEMSVQINPYGASLSSVQVKGVELLWQGDTKSWTGRDLVLFPFIGRLSGGIYTVNGKNFECGIHGIACYSTFKVETLTSDACRLSLVSSDESRKTYPFDFKLTISFQLQNNSLTVSYSVHNLGCGLMYFYLGGHPAFSLPALEGSHNTDTSGNFIDFQKKCALRRYQTDETGFFVKTAAPWKTADKLELDKPLFSRDAVILQNNGFMPRLLRKDGIEISFDLGGAPVLSVWSHAQHGAYVCIEPWLGLPDTSPPTRELCSKPLINSLPFDKTFEYRYSFAILI